MPEHVGRPRSVDSVIAGARTLLGDRLSTNPNIREQHAHGEDTQPHVLPDAVAFVENSEEVARLLALCSSAGVPVIAFGAGTSLEGHVTPIQGGLSLDLSHMCRVLEVNAADMDCRVEAGVTRQQLNAHLHDQGLFFPVDPGSECTIGGMCATRASGTNAVRYGTIRDNVLGLTVALADGRLIKTGGRVRKSATGYDLTRLFIGSEGTLGVITEIGLRLHGIPEAIVAATCQFPVLSGAVETVVAVMQAGIPVARIELLDEVQMRASIAYSHLSGLAEMPTLFFEFHGSPAAVAEQVHGTEEIARDYGAERFAEAADTEARAHLWKARHDAYWAALALRPGCRILTADAIVPISHLTEAVLASRAAITASGLTAAILGHVGDGNFHTVIVVPQEPDGLARAWALDRKIVSIALGLEGSCSGEHGVGLGKRQFLEAEHGAAALSVMQAIKSTLDPRGILNPGKIFPDGNNPAISAAA